MKKLNTKVYLSEYTVQVPLTSAQFSLMLIKSQGEYIFLQPQSPSYYMHTPIYFYSIKNIFYLVRQCTAEQVVLNAQTESAVYKKCYCRKVKDLYQPFVV